MYYFKVRYNIKVNLAHQPDVISSICYSVEITLYFAIFSVKLPKLTFHFDTILSWFRALNRGSIINFNKLKTILASPLMNNNSCRCFGEHAGIFGESLHPQIRRFTVD